MSVCVRFCVALYINVCARCIVMNQNMSDVRMNGVCFSICTYVNKVQVGKKLTTDNQDSQRASVGPRFGRNSKPLKENRQLFRERNVKKEYQMH